MAKEEKMVRREVVFTSQRLDYTALTPPVVGLVGKIIEDGDPEAEHSWAGTSHLLI